jgi:uncharacterized protein YceH (UPF0502 family)
MSEVPQPNNTNEPAQQPPRWQPIEPAERRVLGVLVEKAKTTPSAYPLSLSAVVTGCNQKSSRDPVMDLEPDAVEESLDRLRQIGAVGLVEGHGRVAKYRHYAYQWLDVDKVEVAVMAELLLRGPQTEGELRARAARMEPIDDLAALRPVLASLKQKGLVIPLTPEGRGHTLTHALYPPEELHRLEARFAGAGVAAAAPADAAVGGDAGDAASTAVDAPQLEQEIVRIIRRDLDQLREHLELLRSDVKRLDEDHHRTQAEVDRLKKDLGE